MSGTCGRRAPTARSASSSCKNAPVARRGWIAGAADEFGRRMRPAESDLFRHRRPLRRVIGRDHRIVSRQVPFLAILVRRHAQPRQVTPHRLESFAVFETDHKLRRDRFSNWHRGRLRLDLRRRAVRLACEPGHSCVQRMNQSGQLALWQRVIRNEGRHHFCGQFDRS